MIVPSRGSALVLGGARSGKSVFAEKLALDSGLERHYVATGRAYDDEMRERINAHRTQRGKGWQTHETPLDVVGHLKHLDQPGRVILVDCLTLWVTNMMMEAEATIGRQAQALTAHVAEAQARLIIVSNEVGLGIVPENRMARAFRDHAGRLHQQVAAATSEVYFIAAGLPLKMKG
ncbi:bifunctional adenosylcobinamide kinase/adenosylcobinamide-phosphate guanylyltransferase [Neorhizobium sp. NPDC001467]|uniref:bifunctional adenosylcobinamide kinase/adenosylcobinamide-phosphate guanylyltransferase n=1 Tax=Neorhizobium sp. NPDC001467 TaxID=3390595 RepID=UPI003D0530E7